MNKISLPKGWGWTTLQEVCSAPQYGWTTKASPQGTLRLLRTTDITADSLSWDTVPFCSEEPPDREKYLLKTGDIVISRAGSVGQSYLVKNPPNAVFASYLIRFRPLPIIDACYLKFFLKSSFYWNTISAEKAGSTLPNVNATKLKRVPVPLPPLPEQRAIAHVLQTIQEAKFTRQREIALERERKAALMDHLFSHGTKGEPRKQTEIGEIPESWEIQTFEDCLKKVKSKKAPFIPKRDYQESGKFPVIDQGAAFIAGWTNSVDSVISENLPVIIFGDHTRIFKYIDFPFAIGAQGTQILYPNNDILDVCFFYYALLGLKVPNKGYNRHYRYLREFSIPCPSLQEQRAIAAVFQAIDEKTAALEQESAHLDELFYAMLDELMTGQRSAVPLINTK